MSQNKKENIESINLMSELQSFLDALYPLNSGMSISEASVHLKNAALALANIYELDITFSESDTKVFNLAQQGFFLVLIGYSAMANHGQPRIIEAVDLLLNG